MFKKNFSLFVVFGLLFFAAIQSIAGVPPKINIQGRLTDNAGINRTGDYNIILSIWDNPIGGSKLWEETQNSVPVRNGLFQVFLGEGSLTPGLKSFAEMFNGSERYLQMQVVSESPMMPRQRMVSVGYAFRAETSETADTLANGATIQGDLKINGKLGVGTTNPDRKLEVMGINGDSIPLRVRSDNNNDWTSIEFVHNGDITGYIRSYRISDYYGTGGGIAFATRSPSGDYPIDLYIDHIGNIGIANNVRIDRNLEMFGSLAVHGYKNVVVPNPRNPKEEIYFFTTESLKVAFEDFGEGQLQNGQIQIKFSELFSLCISTSLPQLFLTPLDECNGLYISNRTTEGFEVRENSNGKGNARFCWRAIALRKGSENVINLRKRND